MSEKQQRMKDLRKRTGMTQIEFAAALKVTSSYVSMVERGAKEPSDTLVSLAERIVESVAAASPRSLLRFARESKGMSQRDLARATGYGIGYIQALEEAGARLSEKFALKVAAALDLEIDDLLGGSDHPPVLGDATGTMGATPNIKTIGDIRARLVPLISWSQAGTMTDFTDEVYDYEGHLAVDIKDSRAIAVRIRGDSMEPRFHEGDVAILSPSTAAQTGDLVIARIRDQGVIFKRVQISGGRYQFISMNERYPVVEFPEEEIEWVYPVKSVTVNTL